MTHRLSSIQGVLLATASCAPLAAAAQAVLPPVVVTATRHAQSVLDAPAAMSVVTRQEIEARGADNLLDAVRGEAGVSLQGRSIGGRQVLGLRGLDGKHTLFLVDGRRVAASDGVVGHSDFQYDWIPVEDIERIEVLRGPMSVLYGSEALGGVINVITRRPGSHWRGHASLQGLHAEGGRGGNGARAALAVDGPLGDAFTLRAGLAHSRRGALESPADPNIDELESREKSDAWLAAGWQPESSHRIDAEWRAGREQREAGTRERSGARRYHQSANDLERGLASLSWDARWPGPGTVATQLRAYRSSLEVVNRRSAGVPVNPPQRLQDDVLEGQGSTTRAAHDLTGGFEARNESLEDPGLPGGRSLARHRALYLQDEWTMAAAARLTLGLRHDDHDLFGSQWSPRLYLVVRPAGGWVLKGGASRGFKAPNLKQIVPGARAEGPNTFLGNPDLQPETSRAVEAGLGWEGDGTALQAVAFEQQVRGLIEVQLVTPGPVPGIGTYTYANLARARLRGVEASWSQSLPAGWSTTLALNYLDATQGNGQRLDRRPRRSATWRLDWEHEAWRAGLRVEHSADQRLPAATAGAPSVPAPDLTFVGAQATRSLGDSLELSLGVDNLTDVRLADKSPLFTQVEPPRTWRITLRGRW